MLIYGLSDCFFMSFFNVGITGIGWRLLEFRIYIKISYRFLLESPILKLVLLNVWSTSDIQQTAGQQWLQLAARNVSYEAFFNPQKGVRERLYRYSSQFQNKGWTDMTNKGFLCGGSNREKWKLTFSAETYISFPNTEELYLRISATVFLL